MLITHRDTGMCYGGWWGIAVIPTTTYGGMEMIKTAMLLPAGTGVEPEEILIDDYQSIQQVVGGLFDVVRWEAKDASGEPVVLCGYCNDEGLLLNLEMNWLASGLFGRELRGDVVVTWALSPNGEYDGDDYDMPANLSQWIRKDLLKQTAQAYNMAAMFELALQTAVETGKFTEEQANEITQAIDDKVNKNIDVPADVEERINFIRVHLDAVLNSPEVAEMLRIIDELKQEEK